MYSDNIQIFKRGYIYLVNSLEREQTIKEFTSNFSINYNGKIDDQRQKLINNNITINIKLLDENDNEITKIVEVSLETIKNKK